MENINSENTKSKSFLILVMNYLQNELHKKIGGKVAKEKIDSLHSVKKADDFNLIYRFKLEKSKGDSLFSTPNERQKYVGSAIGVRTCSYLDNIDRYNLSKQFISKATEKERNWIRSVTDYVLKKASRHKFNYGLKAGMATMFLYNLCLAKENYAIFMLRRIVPPTYNDLTKIYYNTGVSFVIAALTFAYI